jgi:hypothetical protein
VTTIVGRRPPLIHAPEERPGWVELVRLRRVDEVRRLVGRLSDAAIEARITSGFASGRRGKRLPAEVVLVRRIDIESARFVLVQLSYEGPSTAEIARRRARRRHRLMAALAGGTLLVALVAQVVPVAPPAGGYGCAQEGAQAQAACSPAGTGRNSLDPTLEISP